ncbi:MAG: hypothetical protein K2J99_15765 [Lachnospiraceae bacterium]|nr:hypothetical protein [Lachnospiraceae bacterium]
MKNKKTILMKVTILFVGIVVGVIALFCFRVRHGVIVKTDRTEVISREVIFYRQDDERWAKDSLGDSSFTMKSSGCLVSCIAAAVSMEGEEVVTPGELNMIFSGYNVYDGEGNIQWSAIESIGGYSVNVYSDVEEQEIYQCLADGHYPIVRVRVNGLGDWHYVLVVGLEDQDYICMDPLKDELTKLSQYLNRVYAVRMVM